MEVANNSFIERYLKALLDGQRMEAQNLCIEYVHAEKTLKQLYEEVIKPALYEVGKLWERNQISVAEEHLATAITEGILNSFYADIIPEKYNHKKVVLACVEKEEHQVGIKMVADIFEMNQWESFFLGVGFPTIELIKYIKEIQPDILAISISVYFNFSRLKDMIYELRRALPHLRIIIGGQAIAHLSQRAFPEWKDITLFNDLHQLEAFLINLK